MLQRLVIVGAGDTDYLLYIVEFTGDLQEGVGCELMVFQFFYDFFGAGVVVPEIRSGDLGLKLFYAFTFAVDVKDNLSGCSASLQRA